MNEKAKAVIMLCESGRPLEIERLTYPVRLTAILRNPQVPKESATILVYEPTHFSEAFFGVSAVAIDGIVQIESGTK